MKNETNTAEVWFRVVLVVLVLCVIAASQLHSDSGYTADEIVETINSIQIDPNYPRGSIGAVITGDDHWILIAQEGTAVVMYTSEGVTETDCKGLLMTGWHSMQGVE